MIPNYAQLRLAFLVGPTAAARLIQAPPSSAVADLLGQAVVKANPFMANMTVADLSAKVARDLSDQPYRVVAQTPAPKPASTEAATADKAKCNPKLASCRRFVALRNKAKTTAKTTKVADAQERARTKAR